MPIMQWDTSLDVGVEAMNREHREILALMNRLYDADRAGQHGAVINQLVADLGEVCVKHFADEEAFMRQVGYQGLASHQELHQRLLKRYGEFAAQIKARWGAPDDAFFHFLKFWLTSHIKGIDMKYGDHVRGGMAA